MLITPLPAQPCTANGQYLPAGTPPLPHDNTHDWSPFDTRPHFEFTEWLFEKVETSEADLNTLLKILAAQKALETGDPHAKSMYENADQMYTTIDSIELGEATWTTFHIKYTGPVTETTPAWKLKTYVFYTRNPLRVAELIAGNTDFNGRWDFVPFEEYSGESCRRYSNLMSGRWAFKKAVSCVRIGEAASAHKFFTLYRTRSPKTFSFTVACSPPLYSARIRLRYQSQPAIKNSILYTCP